MSDENQVAAAGMTLEETTAKINEIKGLIVQSAEAKITIGEILNDCKSRTPYGGMATLYVSIGMSERTAQYYMRIARSEEVQALKVDKKLEGMNMVAILEKIKVRQQDRKKYADKPKYEPVSIAVFEKTWLCAR